MIDKRFDVIGKGDIDAIVDTKKAERRTLEYKAELPRDSDEAKREFLSDIASFANSGGGDILYGVIDEKDPGGQPTGRPLDATGLAGVNETQEQLRLENMIRDGIAPRIAGVQVKAITGFAKGSVILVRVPSSWASPHMVTFKNLSRFYARNSAGKYQLDVGEIRSAFGLSETLPEKIRAIRTDRLAKIASGETPVPFGSDRAAVLHLVPISAVGEKTGVDVSREAQRRFVTLGPLSTRNWDHRFNVDGFLTYDSQPWGRSKRMASTYVQVFRSGMLEVVNQRLLIRQIPEFDEIIPMAAFEQELIAAVSRFVGFQRDIGIAPPIVLMLSLLGVKNFALTTSAQSSTDNRIDRNALMCPDVLIEDLKQTSDTLLRPVFDFIWQAAGSPESPNYGVDGRWKERVE